MKKGTGIFGIVVIVVALIAACSMALAQPVSKYWQDVLRKPNQTWIQQYGYDNESVLAFNVRSLLEVQNRIAQEVVALQSNVEALSDPNEQPMDDPNEVK